MATGTAATHNGPGVSVLIVISTTQIGGPGKGLLQLLPRLPAAGVRPILCTFKRRHVADTPFIRACRDRGVEPIVLDQSFNFDPRPLAALYRLAQAHAPVLLQTHGYKENIFGLILRALARRPWICFLHGTTDENWKIRAYHALDRWVVRLADRVVTVSRELATRTVGAGTLRKVRVVENAIERKSVCTREAGIAWRREQGIAADPLLACIGRLSPEKGQRVLLDAAAQLRDSGHAFTLVFAGEGPDRAYLEDRCAALGLGQSVRFVGHLPHTERLYAAADLVVLPSLKEGMPNVVLEAMLFGLPVVATRVGAVPDMLRDGLDALLVPARDPQALARAIAELIANRARAARMAACAHGALFPRFSPERRLENLLRVYSELEGKA